MAFVAFPDCVRIEVRYTLQSGKPAENTFWFRKFTGAVEQEDVDDIAAAMQTGVFTYFLPMMPAEVEYKEVYARDMTAEISYQALEDSAAGPGTRTGVAVEAHSCVCVQRKSGLVGRSSNGRVYLPFGVGADRVSTAFWGTTFTAAVEGALDDAIGEVGALGIWSHVIASRRLMVETGQVLLSTFTVANWQASENIAAYRDRSG